MRDRLIPKLLLAVLSLAACSGNEGTPADAGVDAPIVDAPDVDVMNLDGGGIGIQPCRGFIQLGTTCQVTLTPHGVQQFEFPTPWPGWAFVDVSLTGSTTAAYPSADLPCNDATLGIDQSCVEYRNGSAGLDMVVVTEAAGNAGTTYLTVGRGNNLGTLGGPVPVSTNSLMNASVAANGKSYFTFTAGSSSEHTIALTGLFSQLQWKLFSDRDHLDLIQACQGPDLVCSAALTAGATYYLEVQEFSGAPVEFQLMIGSGGHNEGSMASPVVVSGGRASTVDVFGHSYYTFTAAVSGPNSIQINAHTTTTMNGNSYSYPSDYGWTLFDDSGFSHVVKDCRDYRELGHYEHCVATLTAAAAYYLRVDELAGLPNRMFDLQVVTRTPSGATSEGTPAAPVALPTGLEGGGHVAARGSSYYSFQTTSSVASYRIMTGSSVDDLTTVGSNLSWFLFDDAAFSHEIFECARVGGIATQSCLTPGLAASTTYYLRVDENDGLGQNFNLVLYTGMSPLTPSSVQAPVAIAVGAAGIDVVQDNTLSTGFYSFATAQAGTYRITSDLSTGDLFAHLAWDLFDDAAFAHQIARCYKPDRSATNGTACTVALAVGTTYYLKVEAVDDLPAIGNNDLHLAVELLPP